MGDTLTNENLRDTHPHERKFLGQLPGISLVWAEATQAAALTNVALPQTVQAEWHATHFKVDGTRSARTKFQTRCR